MKHFFGHTIILLLLFGVTARSEDGTAGRISVFGSSVASGAAATDHQGYWFMMKEVLAERGWQVSSCSRGGDRTTRILDRFDQLLAQHPEYVFIGLSLANEGLRDTDESGRDAVYRPYRWGIQSLIEVADREWHQVVLSHRYAQQETQLHVDGRLAGTVSEQLPPRSFMLGAAGPGTAGFMDWLVYRAALNDLEVESVFDGHLLQASLEVYAPLRNAPGKEGSPVENRAQSLSQVVSVAVPVPASR